MRMLKIAILVLLFAGQGGCSFPFASGSQTTSHYVLVSDVKPFEREFSTRTKRLIVADATGSALVDSRKILFSDNPVKRGYYRLASWAEPPPRRFTTMLLDRIVESELFDSVTTQSSSTLGDLLLKTQIGEFYHDTSKEPGLARIRISVEIIDLQKRVVVGRKLFRKAIECGSYDSQGAVAGFVRGANEIATEIVLWLDESVGR